MSQAQSWVDDPKLLPDVARRMQTEHAGDNGETREYQRYYYQKPVVPASTSTLGQESGIVITDILRRHGGNLTAEVIDAGVSLLCRKLQPKVTPVGGDNKLQVSCKQLSRAIDGIAEAAKWPRLFTETARQGMIGRAGFHKVYVDEADNELKAMELNPLFVFWPQDSTRIPREIVVIYPVPKRSLRAQFKDRDVEGNDIARAIEEMKGWRPPTVIGVDSISARIDSVDTVAVVEAWCLAEGDTPGRHSIAIGQAGKGNIVLLDEEYKHDIHQVVRFSWKPNATGFSGVPLTRHIAPYDASNKRLMNRILSSLDGAMPILMMDDETEATISDLEFQRMVYPRGSNPPQVVVPNPVSEQMIQRFEANRTSAFREAHINENAAAGQIPQQLKSAVAQFAWIDTVQGAVLPQQEAWQDMWTDSCAVAVALAPDQKVRARMNDMLEEVELPRLPRDKFRVSFGVGSGLPSTLSGKLEALQQIQAALPEKLDNADVLQQIGIPDVAALRDRVLAPREWANMAIEMALDEGEFIMPSRLLGPDGLEALVRIASQEFLRADMKNRRIPGYYPAKSLGALHKLIKACEYLLGRGPTPVAPGAPVVTAPAPEVAPAPPAAPAPAPLPAAPVAPGVMTA